MSSTRKKSPVVDIPNFAKIKVNVRFFLILNHSGIGIWRHMCLTHTHINSINHLICQSTNNNAINTSIIRKYIRYCHMDNQYRLNVWISLDYASYIITMEKKYNLGQKGKNFRASWSNMRFEIFQMCEGKLLFASAWKPTKWEIWRHNSLRWQQRKNK